jgi:ferredoxin
MNIFGVCDKQLSCHSCAVHIRTKYEKLDKISEDEGDVLSSLNDNIFRENSTRMSCQIKCKKEIEGMEIEIPRSDFIMFQQDNENETNENNENNYYNKNDRFK